MTLLKKRSSRGFTLVELMIVVAIIGILAALAIAGVKKYMTSAKSAEARNSLGTMSGLASQAWSGERMAGAIIADGTTIAATHTLCGKAPAVPVAIPKGEKYQSSSAEGSDFHVATLTNNIITGSWKCLGFSLDAPQYYQYEYTNADANHFDTIARGDLDGDSTPSSFSRAGEVNAVTSEIKLSPSILEVDPEE